MASHDVAVGGFDGQASPPTQKRGARSRRRVEMWQWTANAIGVLALCVVAFALLSACSKDGGNGQGGGAGAGGKPGAMPPPQVGVITVQQQTVPLIAELPGRLEALRSAQVRARVPGILQKRLFTEGSDVKAGQVLFQIDPSTYEASVQSAVAAQARAEANLAQTTALVNRYEPLQAAKAISPQEFLSAQVAQRQAQADVASAKAAVQTARINLGYATVTAPISGRIGRTLVTEGALVGQGEATQLALIQQINPLYVNFTQPVNDVLKLRHALETGTVKKADGGGAAVHVVMDDGSEYPLTGRLLFSDLAVDPTSGQVSLRAEVPNPQGVLLPGMYVRVRLEQAEVEGGMLVPQQAVTRSTQGDTVLVVDAQGKVSPRPIKLGGVRGTSWVVLGGLQPGEQVIVDGFQKMMNPKAPVKPVPWTPPAAASGPGTAASAGSRSAQAHAGAASL